MSIKKNIGFIAESMGTIGGLSTSLQCQINTYNNSVLEQWEESERKRAIELKRLNEQVFEYKNYRSLNDLGDYTSSIKIAVHKNKKYNTTSKAKRRIQNKSRRINRK
jgi:hypothetical protein